MEQAGPKYTQLTKFIYLQGKAFEIHVSFWKQCFQMLQSERNQITNQTNTWSKVTFNSINSNMVFYNHLSQSVVVVKILKHPLISFSTVPITPVKD